MATCLKPHENLADVTEEIKAVLREELTNESVMSVCAFSKTEIFGIKLKPAIESETVIKICKKLKRTGYRTRVISSEQLSNRNTGVFHSAPRKSFSSVSHANNIIIFCAKVNTPNLPKNPHGLPDPGGKKPKKRK